MSHIYRFLAKFTNDTWKIQDDELKHLRKVLRLKTGDLVEVFDGEGYFASGSLTTIDSQHASLSPENTVFTKPPEQKLRIAAGALKPGLLDDLIPGLVELGVDEIDVFLQESNDKKRISEKALLRWNRIILASVKQCKRPRLTKINVWKSLEDLIGDIPLAEYENKIVFQPNTSEDIVGMKLSHSSVFAVIGGEKGLEESELNILQSNGLKFVSMGPYILRAVTAITASAAILAVRINSKNT